MSFLTKLLACFIRIPAEPQIFNDSPAYKTMTIQEIAQGILQFCSVKEIHTYCLISKGHNITVNRANLTFVNLNWTNSITTFPLAIFRDIFWKSPPPKIFNRFISLSYAFRVAEERSRYLSQSQAITRVMSLLPRLKSIQVVNQSLDSDKDTSDFLLYMINNTFRDLTLLEFPGFKAPKEGQMATLCERNPKLTSITIPAGRIKECLGLNELNTVRFSFSKGNGEDTHKLIKNNSNLTSVTVEEVIDFDIMASLIQLNNLQNLTLEIRQNCILSQLPSTLKSLTLRSHVIVNNLFLDPSSIPLLSNLEYLELINIDQASIIAILTKCPNLISLKIYSNITDFPALLQVLNVKVIQRFHLGFFAVNCENVSKNINPLNSDCHYHEINVDILSQFLMPNLRSLMLVSFNNRPIILCLDDAERFSCFENLKRNCPLLEDVSFLGSKYSNDGDEVCCKEDKLRLLFKKYRLKY